VEWSEKWSEIKELLIGFGGALIVLFIVARVFQLTGSKAPARQQPGPRPSPEEPSTPCDPAPVAVPHLAGIFIADAAGASMRRLADAQLIAGRGIDGDRYAMDSGHWSHSDECQVTLIAQEDLDEASLRTRVALHDGQHRRNLVIRGLSMAALAGKRFRIGSAVFGYDRPRPPCAYIRLVSDPDMPKALGRRAGICARCISSGVVAEGDALVVFEDSPWGILLRRLAGVVRQHTRSTHQ